MKNYVARQIIAMTFIKLGNNIMIVAELIEKLQQYPSDSEILLSIMPCTTQADDLIRCGTYGAIKVECESKLVIISNHNRLETKDAKGNPFTKESAIEYGKQIRDNTVFLIEGTKTLIHR